MKKFIYLLALGLLFAGSVSAQQYYYGPRRRVVRRPAPREQRRDNDFYRVKFGVAAGLNIANTISSYSDNNGNNYSTNSIAGFNAGLFLELPLIYPLSFQPEIMYSGKGYQGTDVDGHFTSRSNFIDVPLLAKFKVSPTFNILVGPQISFLTSTTNTFNDGNFVNQEKYVYNGNTTFFDGVIGVSFDVSPTVELRARYTIDFNETDPYGYTTVPDYRNQVFQLGLGFKFQ